jgi:hypothetical protein
MNSNASFRADNVRIDHRKLVEHSFDLVHFPMYLDQRVPPLVRADVIDGAEGADLVAYFLDDRGEHLCGYLVLNADEHGVGTKTDEFFSTIHCASQRMCPVTASYVGFARCGPPVYAPLFALSVLYRQYGHGVYMPGERLPTPSELTTSGFSVSQVDRPAHIPSPNI